MDGNVSVSPLSWGRSAYPHPGQFLGTGNRCGHDPHKPRWDRFSIPDAWRTLPHTVKKLIEGVAGYYGRPELLPTLANQTGKTNQDGTPRQNRSEAREAESLVLASILRVTDFASLRVGTPQDNGGFIARSCGEIARLAGLMDPASDPSYPQPSQRFWRAFRRLKIAGAFQVHRQYEQRPDGSKRARPAIKTLNPHFLVAVGCVSYEGLKKFRTWCSKRLTKQQAQFRETFPGQTAADAEQARAQLRQQAAFNGATPAPRPAPAVPPVISDRNPDRAARTRYNLALLEYSQQLIEQHPSKPDSWRLQELRRRFPSLEAWAQQQA